MDDAVADCVGKNGIAELFTPTRDVELRAKYGGGLFVPGLDNLKQVSGLRVLQWGKQPFINDQQRILLVLRHDLADCAASSGNG